MGRHKRNKPRRERPEHAALVERYARAYRCSDCHARIGYSLDQTGILDRLHVVHQDGCPVDSGAVSDLPDTIRAAEAIDGRVFVDPRSGEHVTVTTRELTPELVELARHALAEQIRRTERLMDRSNV